MIKRLIAFIIVLGMIFSMGGFSVAGASEVTTILNYTFESDESERLY